MVKKEEKKQKDIKVSSKKSKSEKKETKASLKIERKKEKENKIKEKKELKASINKERKEVMKKIDSLKKEKKATKDKNKKKELKSEIKSEKYKLSRIGKKDTFFSDVMAEMRLVRWPSTKEVVKYSIACFAFVLFFALFFLGIDFVFTLINTWVR